MLPIMSSVAELEFVIVAGEFERRRHFLIRQRPAAMQVVQVVRSILQKDSNRTLLRLAKECGINVAASNIGKAAHVAEHLPEMIWPFPRHRPGADGARTDTPNRPVVRGLG